MTTNERVYEVVRGLAGEVSPVQLIKAMVKAGLIEPALDPQSMLERSRRLIRQYNRWCEREGHIEDTLIGFARAKSGELKVTVA